MLSFATDHSCKYEVDLCSNTVHRITCAQMERSAANASYFLPSYDLKQSTAAAAELKQMIDTARAELVPKKKFAFSKKVNRVKGSELSTAAAEANPVGATPVSAGGTSISGGSAAGAPGVTSAGDAVGISPSQQDLALIQEGRGLRGLRNQVGTTDMLQRRQWFSQRSRTASWDALADVAVVALSVQILASYP